MWDDQGAVLIDPAAHGDHREQDLAFLSVFGAPHLEEILAGYQEAHPLRDGPASTRRPAGERRS